jgi:hypothetical protein
MLVGVGPVSLTEAIWGELAFVWRAMCDGVVWFGRRLCHCERSREMAGYRYDDDG